VRHLFLKSFHTCTPGINQLADADLLKWDSDALFEKLFLEWIDGQDLRSHLLAYYFSITFAIESLIINIHRKWQIDDCVINDDRGLWRREAPAPPPLLPTASAIKLVSIQFIFLSEEAFTKCAPGSELEDNEEEREGRELDSIERGELLRDTDLTAASTPPPRCRRPELPTWDERM